MTCSKVRELLPAVLYGDLTPDDTACVQNHLAACIACRDEYAALQQTRRALDAVPTPPVRVNVNEIYRELSAHHVRRLRRWRRVAIAALSAAAIVIITVCLRLEIRVNAGELIVRWGRSTPQEEARVAGAEQREAPADGGPGLRRLSPGHPIETSPEVEDQLRIIGELVTKLAKEIDTRDSERKEDVKRCIAGLEALQQQANERWSVTERDVSALYDDIQIAKKGKLQ